MSPELDFAIQVARQAGELTLRHFRKGASFDRKPDNSPVTAADREAEQFIRQQIHQRFPDDGILGEEFGATAGGADRIWILDPIDGTKSFIYGVPLFGVLIGLQVYGKSVLGVADFPAQQETYWAEMGSGAHRNGEPIRASEAKLNEGLLVSGSFQSMVAQGRLDGYSKLAEQAFVARTWGDAYGHCMVADGRAVAMIDPVVNVWDTCAVYAIVTEAGGSFTNFDGADGFGFGEAVSANSACGAEVVAAFSK